ncbi:MAG: cbb3-type cytochrome c oxidase subunit I, partial [Sphingomonadales bacterium]|nr:cbb3-type cytochrome c oxidase subunit I [Sphingomonadales bacterium]
MESVVIRTGALFLGLIAAVAAAALAVDHAFAIQMGIVAVAAAMGIWYTISRADYQGVARGILRKADDTKYDDEPIRWGVIATVFWGMAGFLAGVYIAAELSWPQLNIAPYFNFGRLRPLHTSAVIFAFGGNALIATSFYVVQRTCRA